MALMDEATKVAPIAQELTIDQLLDEDYMLKNAHKFISEVEEIDSLNFPFKVPEGSVFNYKTNGKWENESSLAQKDFYITVTSPKWLEHLEVGMSWGTTSFYE